MIEEQTKIRVWHPSHDAYHCSFRVLCILSYGKRDPILLEKLFILDFYFLYPFLLHRSSMPDEVRKKFRLLGVPKPQDQFVQVPSEKMLYREVSVFQKAAIASLVAKGLLKRDVFIAGKAELIVENVPSKLSGRIAAENESKSEFINFLVEIFGGLDLSGARGMRAQTGLVRRQ